MILSSKPLLEGYLHGDSKYTIVPLPTPVQIAEASAFVNSHLATTNAAELAKLARLAVFHNLVETLPGFERLLTPASFAALDAKAVLAVITALAWLGDTPRVTLARSRFADLLKRPELEPERETLYAAAFELADPESANLLKRAVEAKIQELRETLQKPGAPRDSLETRIDRLEEFAAQNLKGLQSANQIRAEIMGGSDPLQQARALVDLYLEIHPLSTPRLSDWAAFRLVRFPHQPRIVEVLTETGARFANHEEPRATEGTIVRARALRALDFFAQPLSPKDREWLRVFGDPGTDVLALRPDWRYAQYHSH